MTDKELDIFVREQNRIKYKNLVEIPNLSGWAYVKARVACFLHGHVWEYNGVHPSCSLLINGDIDMYVCIRCGKIHMSYNPPKGYKSKKS